MNIRKSIFFWKDTLLNKRVIQNHLEDIHEHYFNYSSEKNILIRENRLRDLMKFARKNVPYYETASGIGLSKFPVVNKGIIKENYEKFLAIKYAVEDLSFVTTSGSTGTPFKSYRDREKILRHQADNIFFNRLAGADIGDKLYYFRVWNNINRKNLVTRYIQNIVEVDANNFSKDYINTMISGMQADPDKKYLLSYASSFEALDGVLKEAGIDRVKANVSCLISMSESLPEPTRNSLENIFQAPVVSRYSNMENGFIGQQCLEQKHEYHLNSGSFKVEILKLDEDTPAMVGESGRIVVTDLFNFAMPMIRYDTGDVGILKEASCSVHLPVLSSVEGRRTDFIFTTSGQMLSPHIVTNTMWKFPDIRQFQFIQKTRDEYVLKINADQNPNPEIYIEEFKRFLGENARITVEIVEEIPLLASGKRKKVVNEYHPLSC